MRLRERVPVHVKQLLGALLTKSELGGRLLSDDAAYSCTQVLIS